ncbi:MAG: VTT domain-containing protein [Ramlibacter sp.]|nr:VTT domain-containing protein [Ramlibacter sp.]
MITTVDDLGAVLQAHGILAVSVALFLKRMGIPVPGLPFLLLVGAQGARDGRFALMALAAATLASMLADTAWFFAGRRYGRRMLGLVCRISISPGTCIRRSEVSFERRGALTVLLAKFIPGVAGLAPPLAGALGMRPSSFAMLNLSGTVLWTGGGMALGLLFHRQVAQLIGWLQEMGRAALPFLVGALALYVGWLILRRMLIARAAGKAPRIHRDLLSAMIERGDPVVVVDVRGLPATPDARIPGAVQAPPGSDAFEALSALASGAELVTYCDCPDDATAAHAALKLRQRGLPVRVLAGGFSGWVDAGLPTESAANTQQPR